MAEVLDYTADELTGMNMYTLCHGEDVGKLRKCHLDRKYTYIIMWHTPHNIYVYIMDVNSKYYVTTRSIMACTYIIYTRQIDKDKTKNRKIII